MSADIDCVVIGAGVVGLAIARALLRGREVLVAEATEAIGTGTSSRNSEVIHAGIYYPAGSLKARLCVRGKHLLYAYCAERGVPHKRLGKLIVATDTAQAAQLEDIARRARANGVDDLQYISGEEAMRLEPALRCTAALLSPSTGIVDSHALMLSYQGDAENAGAQCVFHTPLESGHVRPEGGFELRFGGADAMRLSCNTLINAAGLRALALARRIDGVPAASIPASYLCGQLFHAVRPRAVLAADLPCSAARRPGRAPDAGPGRPGQVRSRHRVGRQRGLHPGPGPRRRVLRGGTQLLARPARPRVGARLHWHPPEDLRPREPAADFMIAGPADHGVPGLVNLFGIESPA